MSDERQRLLVEGRASIRACDDAQDAYITACKHRDEVFDRINKLDMERLANNDDSRDHSSSDVDHPSGRVADSGVDTLKEAGQ